MSRIQNENAFLEILHDIAGEFCYREIYEIAKSKSKQWNNHPEDLRQSSEFLPASDSDVVEDRQELNCLTHCEHIVRIKRILRVVGTNSARDDARICHPSSPKLLATFES